MIDVGENVVREVAAITVFCGILLSCTVIGCTAQNSKKERVKQLAGQEETVIEEFGQRWKKIGLATDSEAQSFRFSMIPTEYASENSNVRLLELLPRQTEQVYARILHVQILRDGRWINHGNFASWTLDGRRDQSNYVNHQQHGLERHWYANGQLHIEREWFEGLEHGRARGWYENGRPQYDVRYNMGKEVEGKSWKEDGTKF